MRLSDKIRAMIVGEDDLTQFTKNMVEDSLAQAAKRNQREVKFGFNSVREASLVAEWLTGEGFEVSVTDIESQQLIKVKF
jgi:hypothetical protein